MLFVSQIGQFAYETSECELYSAIAPKFYYAMEGGGKVNYFVHG